MNKNPVSSTLYDYEYYEKYNHGFETFSRDKGIMPSLEVMIKNLDFRGKKVLDIGCGRGELVRYCVLKGAEVYGIDYSDSAVDIAKNILNDLTDNLKARASIKKMDAKNLNFNDNFFDYIFLFDIIEHLHDWELKQCLNEVGRVLRESGVGLTVIHTSPNKYLLDMARIASGLFNTKLKSSEYHVNEQNPFGLSKLVSDYFKGELVLTKDKKYWSNQMGNRGNVLKFFANIVDAVFDSYLIHLLCTRSFLKIFFSTDIWFFGRSKEVLCEAVDN